MSLTVVAPPAEAVVALADVKGALRVEHAADDALIGRLLAAATEEAQQQAARSLVSQSLRLALEGWPGDGVIRLWRPPVQSVTSVQFYDADGVLRTVDAAEYVAVLDVWPPFVAPAPGRGWPSGLRPFSAVRVTYVAGYGSAAQVALAAPDLVLLILGLVAVDYEFREGLTAEGLVQRSRLVDALQARFGWAV